jgi:hypothetical protein
MSQADSRSGTFRKVLIYFGAAAPLPGDELRGQDELEGDLRTVRETLHWVMLGAAIVISGAIGDSWVERLVVLLLAAGVFGLALRGFNAWALRRQRAQRASP